MQQLHTNSAGLRLLVALLATWQFVISGNVVYAIQHLPTATPRAEEVIQEKAAEFCEMDRCATMMGDPTKSCCCRPDPEPSEEEPLSGLRMGPSNCGDFFPDAAVEAGKLSRMSCPDTGDFDLDRRAAPVSRPSNDTLPTLLHADTLDKVPIS